MPPSIVRGAILAACAILLGPPPTFSQSADPSAKFADSIAAAAARAIAAGRPWQATRLVSTLTRDPARAPAAAVLLGAQAASRWEGWGQVVQLLYQRTWLDQEPTGLGHALLGRALVERSQPTAALLHTRRAVAVAQNENRGERLVAHARAFDRAGLLDSAAAAYRAAGRELPLIAEWLTLRAAGVTADSATRSALYAEVTGGAAKGRIPWTEALARDRTGDRAGAARMYASLGAKLAAVRLRLTADSATKAAARAELAALLTPGVPPDDAAEAIALFDRHFPDRTRAEEHRIARRAVAHNQLERAAKGFAAASALLTDRDRFTYATVLSRLGRSEEALPLFEAVRSPDLLGDAAYHRARMIVRNGPPDRALAALRAIPTRFPADSEPASSALFLLADLAADRGIDDSARALFLQAAARYPTTPFGQRAGFQAAMIGFVAGDFTTARDEFDKIAATPNHSEAIGAAYWAGRAIEAGGDTSLARQRFARVIGRWRDSYYAVRAARRIGAPPRGFPRDTTSVDSLPRPLARARVLVALGMRTEARFELDAVVAGAGSGPKRMIAAAGSLGAANWHAIALRLAQRAQAGGADFSRPVAELLYPLPFRELLEDETRRSRAHLYLVAGLIRQESLFDPEARSAADARGLMQILPSVGAAIAKPLGIEWDPALLNQPDLNLDIGIRHLDGALEALEWPERALAAYNGGIDRVRRWGSIRGMNSDPEVFVERIPFTETRDYVRKVLANEAAYLALYGPAHR